MQKISSYIYPNRIELVADLGGFNVECKPVYQRNIKIYNGIDNTIEFEFKNADQKRIDLSTLSLIGLNVMDASGQALPNSPYVIEPLSIKGIGQTTIPQEDLDYLDSPQYLKYSVTAVNNGKEIILYADTKWGAVGTIELIGDALPIIKDPMVYDTFTAEVDLHGDPIWHSSAIPAKFYESVPQNTMTFEIKVVGFIGSIWIEATKNDTINLSAFRNAGIPFGSWTQRPQDGLFSGIIPYGSTIPVGDYSYFRVSYQTPTLGGMNAQFDITKDQETYDVKIRNSGTNYTSGGLIKILGSHLGGTDGVNDLIITIDNVTGGSAMSSYTYSSISRISWTGIASPGTGSYRATGENISGIVESITVM